MDPLTCPYGVGSTLKLRAGRRLDIETPNQAREGEGKGMNRGQEGRTEAFEGERGGSEKSRTVDKESGMETVERITRIRREREREKRRKRRNRRTKTNARETLTGTHRYKDRNANTYSVYLGSCSSSEPHA